MLLVSSGRTGRRRARWQRRPSVTNRMSAERHDAPGCFERHQRAVRSRCLDGHRFASHRHPTHQLAWASRPRHDARQPRGCYVLPDRGLWIPADTPHEVLDRRTTTMMGIYFDPGACPIERYGSRSGRREVSGILAELLAAPRRRADASGTAVAPRAWCSTSWPCRRFAVVLDVSTPSRPRASGHDRRRAQRRSRRRAIARRAGAATAGASSRTLAARISRDRHGLRALAHSTCASPQASGRLADGATVTRALMTSATRSTSAFVAAFRRTTGIDAGCLLARDAGKMRSEGGRHGRSRLRGRWPPPSPAAGRA